MIAMAATTSLVGQRPVLNMKWDSLASPFEEWQQQESSLLQMSQKAEETEVEVDHKKKKKKWYERRHAEGRQDMASPKTKTNRVVLYGGKVKVNEGLQQQGRFG